jgi:transcriptional regulator GlxA family with amidase domain
VSPGSELARLTLKVQFVPRRAPPALHIALLVTSRASPALSLLAGELLGRANHILGHPRFRFELVSSGGPCTFRMMPGVTVRALRPRPRYDYLIVPPRDHFSSGCDYDSRDLAVIFAQSLSGAVVASACLGALTVAATGLLDRREATTHWAWGRFAHERFPAVRWNVRRMISDQRDVITAGGCLALVDLVLHVVARETSTETADRLGQTVLADRARSSQSIYTQRLAADPGAQDEHLSGLSSWIDGCLDRTIVAEEMARCCNMSLRSFHRRFAAVYRMTPQKFLQLKRLERARALLHEGSLSVAQVMQAVGVSNAGAFRRLFSREFGHSPGEFRRSVPGGR